MCNQPGHVDFDKVDDIIKNENKTEQVMLIDENYFHKVNWSELHSWKIHIFEEISRGI